MPVQDVILSENGNILTIKFPGDGTMTFFIRNATVDTNGDGDLNTYSFTNPEFAISTFRSENAFHFYISEDLDIMYDDSISDALIDKLDDIVDTIIANKISGTSGNLNIAAAPHIGVLIEGDDITINDRNSISLNNFEDGEECVLIKHPNGNFTANGERCFVYHVDSLQGWFNAGNKSEPLTRVPITQSMLQRFNYAKPAVVSTSAPAARKSRKSRKSRKARKARKARKSRKTQ